MDRYRPSSTVANTSISSAVEVLIPPPKVSSIATIGASMGRMKLVKALGLGASEGGNPMATLLIRKVTVSSCKEVGVWPISISAKPQPAPTIALARQK